MSGRELWLQQFREVTLILPTWFMARAAFEAAGRFPEASPEAEGEAEDLFFFHAHIDAFLAAARTQAGEGGAARAAEPAGHGCLVRVGDAAAPVLRYRYLESSGSWRTPRRKLLSIRVRAFERRVLGAGGEWARFTVWGAGRDGRHFIAELSPAARARIRAICDVDPKKIGSEYYNHRLEGPPCRLPIIHFSAPPHPAPRPPRRRPPAPLRSPRAEPRGGDSKSLDRWSCVCRCAASAMRPRVSSSATCGSSGAPRAKTSGTLSKRGRVEASGLK